ncbi:MAG: hypothetical protein GY828_08470 [Candidatus Gracilibacteria bacterium]|nr:hypothetical protein [Candidatus Gracilibacteria bacterium]
MATSENNGLNQTNSETEVNPVIVSETLTNPVINGKMSEVRDQFNSILPNVEDLSNFEQEIKEAKSIEELCSILKNGPNTVQGSQKVYDTDTIIQAIIYGLDPRLVTNTHGIRAAYIRLKA